MADIAHLLFSKAYGGLEHAFINYTKALMAHHHRVIAFIRSDAPYIDEVAATGARIEYISPLGFHDPLAAWRLKKWLDNNNADLLLAHNGRAAALAINVAKSKKIPCVAVSHSYKTKYFAGADGIITVTGHMKEHFIKNGFAADKIKIVPNMVPIEGTYGHRGHDYVHEAKANHVPLIAAAGRLSPEKGFDVMIEALAIIRSSGFAFRSAIAGDGELKSKLQDQIKKRHLEHDVNMSGWVDNLREWIGQADVLCVPSRDESFGIVVLEALAMGVPVVACDAPGPVSILQGGGGEIVSRDNPTALADAIMRVLANRVYWKKLREDGWNNVKRYDRKKVSAEIAEAISCFL